MHTLPIPVVAAVSEPVLSKVVTADMMNGVLNEVVGILPVCIPVLVGFIGLRKGISFLQNILHSA